MSPAVPPRLAWYSTKNPPVTADREQECQPHSAGTALRHASGDTFCPDNGGVSGPYYWPPQGLSAGNSQAHSLSALVSGFHLTPTLWTPLRQLLLL